MPEGCREAEAYSVLEIPGEASQRGLNLEDLEKCVRFGHSTFQVEKIEPTALRRAWDTVSMRPAFSWQRLELGKVSELNARP